MVELTNDHTVLSSWIGRTHAVTDTIDLDHATLVGQTLDIDGGFAPGDRLPPLWHFTYFLESSRLSALGRDGHPARGGFLPPVALPRRMWAGGRLTFHGDLHVGETATRNSTITDVTTKQGSAGPLCFVTVTHEHVVDGELRLTEEQDIVYRDDPDPDAPTREPKRAPEQSTWTTTITPSEVLLFRYSALTFNSHRIHYDRDYAREVEGYPSLVVHGPLTATLLAGFAEASTGSRLETFAFRGAAPLFDSAPFAVCGDPTTDGADLWAETPDGGVAMAATATFR